MFEEWSAKEYDTEEEADSLNKITKRAEELGLSDYFIALMIALYS